MNLLKMQKNHLYMIREKQLNEDGRFAVVARKNKSTN